MSIKIFIKSKSNGGHAGKGRYQAKDLTRRANSHHLGRKGRNSSCKHSGKRLLSTYLRDPLSVALVTWYHLQESFQQNMTASFELLLWKTWIAHCSPQHAYPTVLPRLFGLGYHPRVLVVSPQFRSQSGLQKGEKQPTLCTQQSVLDTESCPNLPSCKMTHWKSHGIELLSLEMNKERN